MCVHVNVFMCLTRRIFSGSWDTQKLKHLQFYLISQCLNPPSLYLYIHIKLDVVKIVICKALFRLKFCCIQRESFIMCIVTFPIIAIFRIVIELKTISVYSAICWMHKICTRKNNNLCEFSCAKLNDVNGRKFCENWFVFAGDIFRYFRVHYKVACCKFSFTRWRCLNCMKKVLSLVAEAINSCKKKTLPCSKRTP